MPRGTIEERRAYFRARRIRRWLWSLVVALALTRRPYSVSLDPMTMNSARGEPLNMITVPNALFGIGTAMLFAAALMSIMLLYVTRPGNPQALMDQIKLVRLGSWAIAVPGTIGFVALLVGGIAHGWS